MKDEYFNPIMEKLQSWLNLIIENIPNFLVAMLVLVVAYWLSRLSYKLTTKIFDKRISSPAVKRLLGRTVSVIVVLGGLFLALSAMNLGKSLNSLLAGVGISGLVLGLALQGTLSNTLAGIILSFRKNIRIGDWVTTNGYEGEVMDITLNYTVLKEADNNMVVIPNKQILENPFKNATLTKLIRVTLECGVAYDSDLEKVKEITTKVLTDLYDQEKLDKNLEFYYTEFGGSSINFICRFWVSGEDGQSRLQSKSNAMVALTEAFAKEGIDIPYPIRTLHLKTASPLQVYSSNNASQQAAKAE